MTIEALLKVCGRTVSSALLTLSLAAETIASPLQFHAVVEAGLVGARYSEPWLNSWMEGGVGVLRYERDDDWLVTQGLLDIEWELTDTLSAHGSASYYPDGDRRLGVSESYLQYAPLSAGVRQQWRVGAFYPRMSAENVDLGWSSPYTHSFSAINSWIAEELRVIGAELFLNRPGRQFQSPYSWGLAASVFKANDAVGTLLSWRGWALHNRQTRISEDVDFANYFQFLDMDEFPTSVRVTEETDGQWGFYVGGHWRYLNRTDVRLYYYNNNGNPLAEEDNHQYAWDTQFTSLAIKQRLSDWTLLAQAMVGSTHMGHLDRGEGVDVDYTAAYVMLSRRLNNHRLSLRLDYFDVTEQDDNLADPNDSRGDAITLAWHIDMSRNWQLRFEYLTVESDNPNRSLWPTWKPEHRQQQWVALAQFRF